MGTPDFAVATLAKLVNAGENIVAVITSPDKPAGRGLHMQQSAVKKYAVEKGIPVLQPEKLKAASFLEELKGYKADLQIVVAFRMLPEIVWSMPPKGTFNLHASLLPQYRGAAPINWAIINGEKETGVTTFFLQHEIDTGPIIFQEKVAIDDTDTIGSLYEKLMSVGADLSLKTVQAIKEENYPQIPQIQAATLYHAPKIFKETCQIDWSKTAAEIHNLVRGLCPYPAAWTSFAGKTAKIYKTEILHQTDLIINEIGDFTFDKKQLIFKTGQGYISVLELQQEGKKKMSAEEFLRGFRV